MSDESERELSAALHALGKAISEVSAASRIVGANSAALTAIDRHVRDLQTELRTIFNSLHVVRPDGEPAVIPTMDDVRKSSNRTADELRAIKRTANWVLGLAATGFAAWLWSLFTGMIRFVPPGSSP